MPPKFALLLSTLFTLYLFQRERSRVPRMSHALWIPLIWHLILATRAVSTWLNPAGAAASPEAYLEGSPFDRVIFLTLILAALAVLAGRSANLSRIAANNPWLVLFLVYCGISTFWSDYTFVTFKRWIKEIGNVAMVLVVMTEADPLEAVKAMFRKIAYVAVPLSIVLIKYFGDLGRQFTHSGEMMFVGATTHKNSLGILCAITIIVFVWHLLHTRRPTTRWERSDRRIHILLLLMMAWLMYKADSATSDMCCVIGLAVVVGMELPVMQRNYRRIGTVIVTLLVIGFLLEYSFDLWQVILTGLGRDATLTGRTVLWEQVLAMGTNPLFGTGYDSFWLGDRVEMFWSMYSWKPNQAHNGFLETYLNLGWIGVLLLSGIIISAYRKIAARMVSHDPYQILRMSLYVVALLSNLTEAYFKGLAEVWFVFLLIAIEYPRPALQSSPTGSPAAVKAVAWS
jgi:O-antigen ligase